ncbi:MAG: hypothetical protein VZR08_02250 [Anaerovoracaceae bacterium]|nr:hypothetical protein [Anaerovoracaceae bacterium]
MTGLLIKKQLQEIFKGYFYDAKHNRSRSKAGKIMLFLLFGFLMVGIVGGLMATLAALICLPLVAVDLGWLYFIIMGGLAIVMGAFGGVFTTYSGLYLAKDNDLLLSLPIPVRSIMISRLISVYLMGLMYSGCIMVPTLIVYWVTAGLSLKALAGGIVMLIDVTLIVFTLSCVFGYIIARISQKIKNKGLISALAAIIFIGAYYFFYFRFNIMIQELINNAEVIGAKLAGSSKALYLFGSMGEGNWMGMLLCTLISIALVAATWYVIKRSFLKIATTPQAIKKTVYREKTVRGKSIQGALLIKELRRFMGSTNYMLNCGLGVLIIPLVGILVLWKGDTVITAMGQVFGAEGVQMILCIGLCMLSCVICTAAPSVSLEGKNLWIALSLPIRPWYALKAKLDLQLVLSGPVTVFAIVCFIIAMAKNITVGPVDLILFALLPLLFMVFMAHWGLAWSVLRANTNWSNEIYPIKQGLPIIMALFGGWACSILMGGGYLLLSKWLDLTIYMMALCIILLVGSAVMFHWLKSRGAKRFAEL